MKNKRVLPIPFLILIFAGVVSIFSILVTRTSRAGTVRDNSLQMQMVEQERMAALYFRILSWLSDVTPRTAEPVKASPQPAPVPAPEKTPQHGKCQANVELCAFHPSQILATKKPRAHSIN